MRQRRAKSEPPPARRKLRRAGAAPQHCENLRGEREVPNIAREYGEAHAEVRQCSGSDSEEISRAPCRESGLTRLGPAVLWHSRARDSHSRSRSFSRASSGIQKDDARRAFRKGLRRKKKCPFDNLPDLL